MKKKWICTIELPGSATDTVKLYAAIQRFNGKIVNTEEKTCNLTDEECRFWCERWENLPNTDIYAFSSTKTVYTVSTLGDKLKVGVAKRRKEDTFNYLFGRALADARCFGDRKLERALLHFTPEQIKNFFK